MSGPLRPLKGGLGIECHVTPSAAEDRITGLVERGDGVVRIGVRVRAVPDKGAANRAVIALVAKAVGIPKSALNLHAGATARTKTIRADEDVAGALKDFIERL